MQRICIFCGSQVGINGLYRQAATALGQLLVRHGYSLVYGGGHVGLMGVIADAVLASGGEVIGVIPESMVARELAHTGLTQLQVVSGMHARKARMAELADAFIDRKSTRLNSSHLGISYAVFCLKKKNKTKDNAYTLL